MKSLAFEDARETLRLLPAAWFLTWSDTKARYRRSVLGPFWLVLGTAVGVAGLGFLWSTLFNMERAVFIPSLTVGLIVWQMIVGCITESPGVFVRNAQTIRNLKMPYLFFPVQLLARQLINFGHNLVIVFVVLLIYPHQLGAAQWLVPVGFALIAGNLLWLALLLALLGARFRDLEYLVAAIMPLLFFLSPVLFRPRQLGDWEFVVWLNPLSHFVSLMRDPFLGEMPPRFVYIVALTMLILGWLFTMWLCERKYGRIAFWV